MPKQFYAYYRVSTQKQGASGLGLEAQQEQVRRYVSGVGGSLLEEYTEIESGKLANRPILNQAIAACRRSKATLLIAKLDRLGRNVAFVSSLMEGGTDFIALDAPYANRLLLHVLSAVAEHEREMISQRTKAALLAAKARGVVLGRHGATLAAQHRAAADSFAKELHWPITQCLAAGAVRLQDVADYLNAAGYLTREQSKWGPASAQRVMKRLNLYTPGMIQAGAGMT